jgi:hypothetical protein
MFVQAAQACCSLGIWFGNSGQALGKNPVRAAGPFSNRASFVNSIFLVFVAVPGSWFSPRSKAFAATSGSKYGRRNVHSGLA